MRGLLADEHCEVVLLVEVEGVVECVGDLPVGVFEVVARAVAVGALVGSGGLCVAIIPVVFAGLGPHVAAGCAECQSFDDVDFESGVDGGHALELFVVDRAVVDDGVVCIIVCSAGHCEEFVGEVLVEHLVVGPEHTACDGLEDGLLEGASERSAAFGCG